MTPRLLSYVPTEALLAIETYLQMHSLGVNRYRLKVGTGISQCLGIVGKRCLPPDLSRISWKHPLLHYLVMEFAKKHVPCAYTSVQVNVNYPCNPHRDIGNIGNSYIIGFGSYIGGSLVVENQDYDIYYRGLLFDGSQQTHWTRPWNGNRYSLVFHTLAPKPRFGGIVRSLDDYEAILDDGVWKMRRKSDGLLITKDAPLPHYLQRAKTH